MGERRGEEMNAEEIRSLNHDCQKEINETKSYTEHRFGIDSLNVSMITEGAAQLADVNEKLKIILNPPLMYYTSNIGPNERMGFFDDLPQPLTFTPMETRTTMRDQFAMAAMQGLFSNSFDEFWVQKPESMSGTCKHAYEWADSMLEARTK